MNDECLICKKHHTQSGKCWGNKENCLFYEEEQRGKMIRTNFSFNIDILTDTPIIKSNSKIIIDDSGKDVEMVIIKINSVNLDTRICNVTAEYHESEKPIFERKKMFKIVD